MSSPDLLHPSSGPGAASGAEIASPPLRVAIVGATGYTGVELLRLLAGHPRVQVTQVVARREVGRSLKELFPHLRSLPSTSSGSASLGGLGELVLEELDPDGLAKKADLAFLALPHKTSASVGKALLERGVRVLDLSADFRLKDPALYTQWYGEHPCPELIADAIYGLVEHQRKALFGARLVAVPGCYPTSVTLAAAPLLKAKLASPQRIFASSLSGVSGAGREARLGSLFCEVGEGAGAYGALAHRHQPEMEQALSAACGEPVSLSFVPHLVPMSRGIHSTVALDLLPGVGAAQVAKAFEEAYTSEPFVSWLGLSHHPNTAQVRASNQVLIGAAVDERLSRVVVFSAIDNLVKGASGQAVQCLNAVMGWPEQLGLLASTVFP